MCGIAGVISSRLEVAPLKECVQLMIDAQRHRGPDDEGAEVIKGNNEYVAFGHCRLSIIDVSPTGHQPMQDQESRCWLTFNGEIYNYQELRQELKGLGYVFRTGTDTEVLLKAYAAWGSDCLQRLRGMFAFALWDPEKNLTFCARDHTGIKPFYYYKSSDLLIFASEVRAILSTGMVPRKIDHHGLRSYLAYGSVQDPLTMVKGVRSLLPGYAFVFQRGKMSTFCYWKFPGIDAIKPAPADIYEKVGAQLERAIGLQKISDVPLGTLLSGGIDSAVITAMLQRTSSRPVKSFSIIFDEADYDERYYSRLAANYIGTEHTELRLEGEKVCAELESVLMSYDQPSVDGLNTYFVSKAIKDAGLTVALSGLGGDELFGGYDGYSKTLKVQHWGNKIQGLPDVIKKKFSRILSLLPQSPSSHKLNELFCKKINPYFVSRLLFSSEQVSSLLNYDLYRESDGWAPERFTQLINSVDRFDEVNRASALEIQTYMLSTLLRDTDQMSMAHSLEVRVPFLDHRLVENIFSIPGAYKIESNQPKPLLTKSTSNAIPSECIFRPKMGFTLPFEIWLRKSLLPTMEQTFKGESGIDFFSPSGLNNIWNQFNSGLINWSRVWAIFVLCDWLRRNKMTL